MTNSWQHTSLAIGSWLILALLGWFATRPFSDPFLPKGDRGLAGGRAFARSLPSLSFGLPLLIFSVFMLVLLGTSRGDRWHWGWSIMSLGLMGFSVRVLRNWASFDWVNEKELEK